MSDVQRIIDFFRRDIWRIRTKRLSPHKYFLIRYLRVFILAIQEFRSNKCQLNASALTFYTLLSIVPIVAMVFGIAKGFGYDVLLEDQILKKFPGQEQTFGQIIGFANNLLLNARGGLIAGISVIILFWTVIKVLNSIETSFNDIWGIKKSRSMSRKISDYLSIMLICPFFVIATSTLTVFLHTKLELILRKLIFLGSFGSFLLLSLHILPFVMVWILFTFLYMFMPNTKVNLSSALIGGILAGTIYQVVQIIYVQFQIGVANANVIYGSFAAVPLFLFWLQLSWKIVLFGTEVSFAHQNVDTYEFEQDCLNVSHAFKRLLALQMASVIIKRFAKGESPLTANQLSDALDVPIRLVEDILFELTEVKILTAIKDATYKQSFYQPAQDINHLTVSFVSEQLDKDGTKDIPVLETKELHRLQEILNDFERRLTESPMNQLLKDI